jgi:hypothetical protein
VVHGGTDLIVKLRTFSKPLISQVLTHHCIIYILEETFKGLNVDTNPKIWLNRYSLKNRTRNAQILGGCLGWEEPRPRLEFPYLVSSDQNLNWDIFVVGRFQNFGRFGAVAKQTPES